MPVIIIDIKKVLGFNITIFIDTIILSLYNLVHVGSKNNLSIKHLEKIFILECKMKVKEVKKNKVGSELKIIIGWDVI